MNSKELEAKFKVASKNGDLGEMKHLEKIMYLDNNHWDDCAHDTKENGNLRALQYAECKDIEINWELLMRSRHEIIFNYAAMRNEMMTHVYEMDTDDDE